VDPDDSIVGAIALLEGPGDWSLSLTIDQLVNVWALPLIIGSAAEYGVNIVLRSLESRVDGGGPRPPRSTVLGVVFNGLTTMAGFGSLLVAHHRGVWSLGLLLVIGSAMTLTASLVVLPTLVRLGDRRRSPAANRSFAFGMAMPASQRVSPASNGVAHHADAAERNDALDGHPQGARGDAR